MKQIISCLLFFSMIHGSAQQVGINTNAVHSSAVLEVKSTTQGFLLPRLSTSERLAINTTSPSPATSLLVFDTDTKTFWYFNASQWKELKDSYQNTDIGVIAAFHGTPPAGWLPLDGSSVTALTYPGLAAKYTAWVSGANIVLPDYRGYFLRGIGTNTDGTAGAATPGAKQTQSTALPAATMTAASAGGHVHTATFSTTGAHTHQYSDGGAGGNWHHSGTGTTAGATRNTADISRTTVSSGAHTHAFNTASAATHTHSISTGGDTETKPSNITITWAVKAR